jgi:hypothetical protein
MSQKGGQEAKSGRQEGDDQRSSTSKQWSTSVVADPDHDDEAFLPPAATTSTLASF